MSAENIYIDRSGVHEGDMPRLKAGLAALVEFVDANHPHMLTHRLRALDAAPRS